MVNPLIVKRKLIRLMGYLEELESLSHVTLDEYLADPRQRRAVERLIQLVVDKAVDINTHLIVDAGRPAPNDAYSSFFEAERATVLPRDLAEAISPSTGERNIIVHEYESTDDAIVHGSIGQTLDLYRRYVAAALGYLERQPK